jgi:RHS repeat-associated protein
MVGVTVLGEHPTGGDHRPVPWRTERPSDRVPRCSASPPQRPRRGRELRENTRRGFRVARPDSRLAIASPTPRRHQGNRLPLRRHALALCLGARDYEPVVGRWVSKDASRFVGGPNLYAYANGDPVNFVDSEGKVAIAVGAGIPLTAAGVVAGAAWLGHAIGDAIDDALDDGMDDTQDDAPPEDNVRRRCFHRGTTPEVCLYVCPNGQIYAEPRSEVPDPLKICEPSPPANTNECPPSIPEP